MIQEFFYHWLGPNLAAGLFIVAAICLIIWVIERFLDD